MALIDNAPIRGAPVNGLYNLIVANFEGQWTGVKDNFLRERLFKYTDDDLVERFRQFDDGVQAELMTYPTVFTEEIKPDKVGMARIGWITNLPPSYGDVQIEYQLPSLIPPIPADQLARALRIESIPMRVAEMQQTHWAVKKGDLFSTLFRAGLLETAIPSLFQIPTDSSPSNLVSVMMPFESTYQGVYQSLKATCKRLGVPCKRADDIWEDSVIIQDIFSLIYRSKVVICDFSKRNPNVLYEAGLAHALGREVIPIVQNEDDIPFDIKHHRYICYLNNAEGLQDLEVKIEPRIDKLIRR